MNALYRPCPHCLPVIKAGILFQHLLQSYDAVELQAQDFNNSQSPPLKINVNTLAVRCLKCKGMQEVLTTEAEHILKLFRNDKQTEIVPRFGLHIEEEQPLTDEQGVPL
jgi:hypothetical protein